MAKEGMRVDKSKITPERIRSVASVYMTPRVPEKINSSFAPTQKSQSGEFSMILQADRMLPKYNAAKLKQRFNEKVLIGVRSPYALIDSLRLKGGESPVDWEEIGLPDCKKLFERYLGDETIAGPRTLRFEELFDPMHGSPLFKKKQLVQSLQESHLVTRDQGVHTAATSKPCSDAPKWVSSTLPWTADGIPPAYDGPMQGGADDCWYIAALTSIAWVFPALLTADNNAGIFILDPEGPLTGQELLDNGYLYPTNDLPVPATAGPGSMAFWWSKSKRAERWVAMMEKAYAIRYLGTGQDRHNACGLPRGDPQYALYILMGDEFWSRFWNETPSGGATVWKDESHSTSYDVATLWTLLNNNCTSPTGKTFQKIHRPAVAFTYDSAESAPRLPGEGLLQYSSDLLVASHSYSLLGIMTESAKKFVVLRNPWGIISGVTWDNHLNLPGCGGSLAGGPMYGFKNDGTNQALWTRAATGGKLANGVFALDIDTFARYFRGFSWA